MARSDPIRVMVVDDQADARYLVRVLLEEHADLAVVAEADGEPAALAGLQAGPEVALVDARMPLISGFELAPRLLERAPGLRIALLTSIVDDHVRAQAATAGIERCVAKGEWSGLAEVVRGLAGRQA
jgi:CheY-like chemotaxis protein